MLKYSNIDFYSEENQLKKYSNVKADLIFGDMSRPVPKYTIIIPTYRRPDLLEETLLSAINQKNFNDYEIIIVEHGQENDDTEKKLQKYRNHKNIFYYKLSKWTIGGNANKGAELVRTKWFTLLCDDDLLAPNYLYAVDNILETHPEIEGISPYLEMFSYDPICKKVVPNYNEAEIKQSISEKIKNILRKYFSIAEYQVGSYLIDNYYVRTGACCPHLGMYKKENFLALGGWNIDCDYAADMIFNVNYTLKYNLYYTTEVLGKKREGIGNASYQKDTLLSFILLNYSLFKTLPPHLKILKSDARYTKLLTSNMVIEECKFKFEDIKDFNFDIPKEYYNKDGLNEFQSMRKKFLEQLRKANPPVLKYIYTNFNTKFQITGRKNDIIEASQNEFIKYLKKKNVQKRINKLIKKYSNKKIVLYGAGIFTDTILQNYDLSKLNIIAIADKGFAQIKDFHGYKIIDPKSLKTMDFDILLISMYKDFIALNFFENDLFLNFKPKFKIATLIKMSFWDSIKIVNLL